MRESLSEYMKIVVEILLFALLMSLVMFITNQSYSIFYTKDEASQLQKELTVQREFYAYDNKKLKADDVLLLIQKYNKVYNISLQNGYDGSWVNLTTNITDTSWNPSTIKANLIFLDKPSDEPNYLAILQRDSSGTVNGIAFDYIE